MQGRAAGETSLASNSNACSSRTILCTHRKIRNGVTGTRGYRLRMTATADQAQQELRVLKSALRAVDGWLRRADKPSWADVAPGSPLAGDDRKADPFQVSHAVASAIHVAVDHAESFRRLVEGCGTCSPAQMTFGLNSYYSILRGAMENAARAIWLLAPESRNERLLRRLRLQTDNVMNSDKVASAMGTATAKPLAVRLDRVREIAVRAGLDPQLATKRPGNLDVIRSAGAHVGGADAADHTEALWRACSGSAHGDAWAGLSMHDRDVQSRNRNVVTLRLTASTRFLTTVAAEAFAVIESAHELFDLRNKPPY